MANTNFPNGFMPLGLYADTQPGFGLRTAKILSTDNHPIYRGDPIVRAAASSGYILPWSTAVAPGLVVGIFWGAKYHSTALGRTTQNTFWPGNSDAAADATCYFIPIAGSVSPLFVVQADAGPATAAMIGMNFSPVMGTGSIKGSYGLSNATLGISTASANALEFKMAGLWSEYAPSGTPGTDDTAAYNRVVVRANTFSETGHA